MAVHTINFDRVPRLAVQLPVAVGILRKMAVHAMHPLFQVDIFEMHCLGEQVLSLCRAHDCQPTIACRSAQIATVQALIAMGQGVSLLPDMARRADRSNRLVYRSLANDESRRTVAAIWHRHSYHSPAAECFLADLRAMARKLAGSARLHLSASGSS